MVATKTIIDTNVIVRFFIRDNEAQFQKARDWFRQATVGKREIMIKTTVVAEVVYVLESVYDQSHEQIASVMFPFLSMPVLEVEEREVLLELWGDYISGLHFVDAFLLSYSRQHECELLSFDKKLCSRIK